MFALTSSSTLEKGKREGDLYSLPGQLRECYKKKTFIREGNGLGAPQPSRRMGNGSRFTGKEKTPGP